MNIHTRECQLKIKQIKLLMHAISWVNLKNSMLSGRSLTQSSMILFVFSQDSAKFLYGCMHAQLLSLV